MLMKTPPPTVEMCSNLSFSVLNLYLKFVEFAKQILLKVFVKHITSSN